MQLHYCKAALPVSAFFLTVLVAQCLHANEESTHPTVETTNGKILGSTLQTNEGQKYHAFRGIPYAKPPIGNLKFKPPQPAEPWNGILNATSDGSRCPQYWNIFTSEFFSVNEDCLFINVYTPHDLSGKHLPVLVFIHGGGFVMGSGRFDECGPQYFMDKNVVLVTFNYRLGVYGFLSTEDENAPGNYAMLDQVLALRWVQQNVAHFGGDPSSVTIFGVSAGGASVAFLMLSPLTKGLFHAAIAQSGTTLGSWSFQRHPLIWAKKLAEKVNCPTENTTDMVHCFTELPAEELLKQTDSLYIAFLFPMFFAPVKDAPGGGGFLTEDPIVLLREKRIGNKVPFITGVTKDEGDLFYHFVSKTFETSGEEYFTNEFPSKYLPYMAPHMESDQMTAVAKAIREEYFGGLDVNDPQVFLDQFEKIFGDTMFVVGTDVTLALTARAGVPTYAYRYVYQGDAPGAIGAMLDGQTDKVQHGAELLLQFHSPYLDMPGVTTSVNDSSMRNLLNTLWSNIAQFKKPSFKNTGIETVEWLPYSEDKPNYLELDLTPKLKSGLLSNRTPFWKKLNTLKESHEQKTEL